MFSKRNDEFYQKLWKLMVPIVLQNLMLALVAVADAFMLGGLDQNYMSAVSLAAAGTYRFHWPVVVIYACTCIDEVGKLPWVLYHFRKYKWVKDLTR